MNTQAHLVAPEELMAYLDGELPAHEADAVAAHLDQCEECAGVIEEFRATSKALASWTVEAAHPEMADGLSWLASNPRAHKPHGRSIAGGWKMWVLGGGGLVTAALAALVLSPTLSMRRPQEYVQPKPERMNSFSAPPVASPPSGVAGIASMVASTNQTLASPQRVMKQAIPTGDAFASKAQTGRPAAGNAVSAVVKAPMIARTVSFSIVVKDFSMARAALEAILARHHGYSAQLTVNTAENAPHSLQASLRIPVAELNAAIGDLRTLGRVENEVQSGEEVTAQHADLAARLENARETEARMRAILEQRTGHIDDVLEVEQEIARVRGEIEEMEASLQGLEHRVDFAGVDLQLTDEFEARLNAPAGSVPTRLHNAFVNGFRNAADTVLGIALFFIEFGPALLIWLAILAVPGYFAWRRYRRLAARLQ